MNSLLFAEQKPAFVNRYNRSCFMFDHRLHENAIFDLDNIVELSRRLPGSYWSTDVSAVSGGWGGRPPRLSLPDTIASIAETNSLVLLKGLESDGELRPVYEALVRNLSDQVGAALASDMSIGRATLIVSSPGRITPYHIDGEVNFLLQLRGAKVVYIFDQSDRTLLTDEELEGFYSGDFNAAQYKAERQAEANVFDFVPGKGAHLPLHAPHWVSNGDSVSVSLSLNCTLHSHAKSAHVYRFNRLLRGRGRTPMPPGVSPWRDELKAACGRGYDLARSLKRHAALIK